MLTSYRLRAGFLTTAQARPHFEAVVAKGLGDDTTLLRTFQARVAALGLEAALQQPALIPESASAAFGLGCGANGDTEDGDGVEQWLEDVAETDRNRIQALWDPILCHIYEQGLARMERFFETGKPQHSADVCSHLYSMMCNNLAIRYSNALLRYDDALLLHRKGIEASPFAEHYYGIFRCREAMVDEADENQIPDTARKPLWEKAVAAGEELWQFSSENGFGRNEPNTYIPAIAQYLHLLQRDAELPAWLERLVQWQEDEDGDAEDPAHLSDEAMRARMDLFSAMRRSYRVQSEKGSAALKPQVRKSRDWDTHYTVGNNLWKYFEAPDEAIEFYEKHLKLNPRRTEDQRIQAEDIAENLRNCRAGPCARPWWQVWK
ncbi:MAG: hypothetical protein FWD68_09965 [Alphaproteobacteria bacterium]|nr:hypothetical protein [Alphaproteobacteria bacterium]